MDKKNIYALSLLVGCVLPVSAQRDSIAASFANQKMEVGANKDFTRAQSTAAITIIENKDVISVLPRISVIPSWDRVVTACLL